MENPTEEKTSATVFLPSLANRNSNQPAESTSGLPSNHDLTNERQRYSGNYKQVIANHEAGTSTVPGALGQRYRRSHARNRTQNTTQTSPDLQPADRLVEKVKVKGLRARLLPKLIDIFETGGINCVPLHLAKKEIPWQNINEELVRTGCYVTGWPDICLPVMETRFPDMISHTDTPRYWRLEQWLAMEIQLNKGAVRVLPRPKGRLVLFEAVDEAGNTKDSTLGFSMKWVRANLRAPGPAPDHPISEKQPVEDTAEKKEIVKTSSLFGRMKKRVVRLWRRDNQPKSEIIPSLPMRPTLVSNLGEGSGSGSGELHFSESRTSFGSSASEAAQFRNLRSGRSSPSVASTTSPNPAPDFSELIRSLG